MKKAKEQTRDSVVVDLTSIAPGGKLDVTEQFKKLGPQFYPLPQLGEILNKAITEAIMAELTPIRCRKHFKSAIRHLEQEFDNAPMLASSVSTSEALEKK